jgi:hypothetical protein
MKLDFKISDKALQEGFNGLTPAQLRSVFRVGTRKGMLVVRKKAVANYKKIFPGSNKWKAIWAKNYKKYKRKNIIGAYVCIHPDLVKQRLDWGGADPRILKWMEYGTPVRTTKKGYNRGEVNDTGFFSKAIEAKMHEAEAVAVKHINEGILKKAKKLGLV